VVTFLFGMNIETKGGNMKTRKRSFRSTVFIYLFLSGVIVFWGFQVSGQEWTEAQKEVWKSVNGVWENFTKGDLEAVMAGFHDDSIVWWSDKAIPLGKDTRRPSYYKWLSGYHKPVSYELEPLSIHIFGNVANTYYLYKYIREGYPDYPVRGRVMETYLKQNNKWLIIGGMNSLCNELPKCK
jgi:ketosteroid isomerase-like protein